MTDAEPTKDTQPDEPNEPANRTARAQANLILESVDRVAPFPQRWEEEGGVQYFYREGTLLVRDWHVPRLRELLADLEPRFEDLPGSLTRITWDDWGPGRSVPDVIDRHERTDDPDRKVGMGILARDHLVYVCPAGGHSCAATEQEPVPPDADPVPRPQIGPDAADPRCGLGKGVRVLVMDTGLVSGAAQDHWWLAGVTGEVENPFAADGTLMQDGGHGTFVAGCVRVTAPEASVRVLDVASRLPRTESRKGDGTLGAIFESELARLVRRQLVAEPGQPPIEVPDILVLNFAGTSHDGGPLLAFSALYDDVVQHLKELLILSPAGNEGDTRKNWPASFAWVVSVGGLAANWRDRAPWSNHGPNVDVYAPGDRLVNAFASGTYTYQWEGPLQGTSVTLDGMARWSGTSFSTPLVAGMVAARMSTTGETSRRAWRSLLELAERQAVPGVGPVLYPGQACGGRGCGCGSC